MSIIRVGLAETKKFAQGYEAIFGKSGTAEKAAKPATKKRPAKATKKKGKK